VDAGLLPQKLLAVTEITHGPKVVAVYVMLFVVLEPDQPQLLVHV
jgi:hypothetical protein